MIGAAAPVRRGCGSRREGGVYLECGLVSGGAPIENFVVDPPIADGLPATWLAPHRTPFLFVRNGVTHIMIWVGEEFYPNVHDFIEETRVAGASRRVPATFDFSSLTVESRLYFVHPHARVDGAELRRVAGERAILPAIERPPVVDTCCPGKRRTFNAGGCLPHSFSPDYSDAFVDESTGCLGLAKYLPTSDAHGFATSARMDGDGRTRTLPCGHRYTMPDVPTVATDDGSAPLALPTRPALFLMLPLTGVAMVKTAEGKIDPRVAERVRAAQVETYPVDA